MVESLRDLCRNIGIPENLIMDGDGAQNNPEVLRVCREFLIPIHNSEPENQQQHIAERGSGTRYCQDRIAPLAFPHKI